MPGKQVADEGGEAEDQGEDAAQAVNAGQVEIEAEVFGATLPKPLEVLSTPTVQDGEVRVKADALPSLGIKVAEDKVREITDFQQKVGGLPGGIELSKVTPAKDGVEISVEGSSVRLAG